MKILDFAKKMRKSDIFEFFEFFCEDGWLTEKFDHENALWYENRGDWRLQIKLSNNSKIWNFEIQKNLKLFLNFFKNFIWTFSTDWRLQPGLKGSSAPARDRGHLEGI
jgi:hypothetical protein